MLKRCYLIILTRYTLFYNNNFRCVNCDAQFVCDNLCPNGYVYDEDDCQTCDCADPLMTMSTFWTTPSPTPVESTESTTTTTAGGDSV